MNGEGVKNREKCGRRLSSVATCVFSVRLLYAVVFLKYLLWFELNQRKYFENAVNSHWKRTSQHASLWTAPKFVQIHYCQFVDDFFNSTINAHSPIYSR